MVHERLAQSGRVVLPPLDVLTLDFERGRADSDPNTRVDLYGLAERVDQGQPARKANTAHALEVDRAAGLWFRRRFPTLDAQEARGHTFSTGTVSLDHEAAPFFLAYDYDVAALESVRYRSLEALVRIRECYR
jgi:hypothetical protein